MPHLVGSLRCLNEGYLIAVREVDNIRGARGGMKLSDVLTWKYVGLQCRMCESK
jgi:hypothetical protein